MRSACNLPPFQPPGYLRVGGHRGSKDSCTPRQASALEPESGPGAGNSAHPSAHLTPSTPWKQKSQEDFSEREEDLHRAKKLKLQVITPIKVRGMWPRLGNKQSEAGAMETVLKMLSCYTCGTTCMQDPEQLTSHHSAQRQAQTM